MAKTTARKTRCDGERTREAILAAAEAEFAEKGFELASAREICRRADANAALISRYFGSKESLYRIVAKRLFGDLGAPLAVGGKGRTRALQDPFLKGCQLLHVPFRPKSGGIGVFAHHALAGAGDVTDHKIKQPLQLLGKMGAVEARDGTI